MRITLIALVLSFSISAQQPKTVTDYFLALPDSFYAPYAEPGTPVSRDALTIYRRSMIRIEDVKNGYLRLERKDWEGWGEFALFKKRDGSYVVAHTFVECGPACGGDLYFHEYAGGKWTDVTSDVFEAPDDDDVMAARKRLKAGDDVEVYFYSLPRKGTDIMFWCSMCKDGNDLTLIRYAWDRSKFIRK